MSAFDPLRTLMRKGNRRSSQQERLRAYSRWVSPCLIAHDSGEGGPKGLSITLVCRKCHKERPENVSGRPPIGSVSIIQGDPKVALDGKDRIHLVTVSTKPDRFQWLALIR